MRKTIGSIAMQLREFALQVLFGETIEEKLSFPREEIVDTVPGTPIATPKTLTRPQHLQLRERGVKASHPSAAKLIDEKERGRLLHFFGNHELLATELMALAILKFPDAPKSFRMGLLETLKDEQIHTQIYMHRMKQCGVAFGELPLSDYFWKSVSSMEDPLDYVTRLSLTFEQANLDYSREYGKLFSEMGDGPTAGILDKIYHDEIDHVGFGLKWFRKWKAQGKTDWEAYREKLVFPLSPSRAKGNHFNAAGRAEAGFDASFINEIKVFNQSRGRTPHVYWFNPETERFAAQNNAQGFRWGESPLQADLEFLPASLSRKGDILVLQSQPSHSFLDSIQAAGIPLPELLISDPENRSDQAPPLDRKLGELRPWSWSPESLAFFDKTRQRLTRDKNFDTHWNEGLRLLHSKTSNAAWANSLPRRPEDEGWLAPTETNAIAVRNVEELLSALDSYREKGYENIACKAPFGTSAQGMRCIKGNEGITPTLHHWIENALAEQGEILVEPWLDRVFDFSVQFEFRENSLKRVAFTRLINNERGQFKGIVTNTFTQGLSPELLRFIMEKDLGMPRLHAWYDRFLFPILQERLNHRGFRGALGIDAFVYRDRHGELKLKPIVEINPRYTMGRIAHELSRHVATKSVGFFQILTRSQIKKLGHSSFQSFAADQQTAHPLLMLDQNGPRIKSGTLLLTDPQQAKRFCAIYHVRHRIEDLPF